MFCFGILSLLFEKKEMYANNIFSYFLAKSSVFDLKFLLEYAKYIVRTFELEKKLKQGTLNPWIPKPITELCFDYYFWHVFLRNLFC